MATENTHPSWIHGILLRGIGGFYTALTDNGEEYTLRCRKKFRRLGISPLTGDEILFTPGDGESNGWIEDILPRRSLCLRPPAANVTLLMIVAAPEPLPDLLLIDRLLSRAFGQNIHAVLVLNKADLISSCTETDTMNPDPLPLEKLLYQDYAPAGIPVIPVSAASKSNLDALIGQMEGEITCFAGQSGVGKSTLLNALTGFQVATGDLSARIARGKNTTRSAELFVKDNLRIMDSAGFSLLETEKELPPDQLKNRYPEFLSFEGKCRFRGCLHDREPGCAVREAVQYGLVSSGRFERYHILLRELIENWNHRYD